MKNKKAEKLNVKMFISFLINIREFKEAFLIADVASSLISVIVCNLHDKLMLPFCLTNV